TSRYRCTISAIRMVQSCVPYPAISCSRPAPTSLPAAIRLVTLTCRLWALRLSLMASRLSVTVSCRMSLVSRACTRQRAAITEAELADGGSGLLIGVMVLWGDADTIRRGLRVNFTAGATHVCLRPVNADGDFCRTRPHAGCARRYLRRERAVLPHSRSATALR